MASKFPNRKGDIKLMLLDRLTMAGDDECWPYIGARNPDGYGKLYVGGYKYDGAHRIAFQVFNGPIPKDKLVRHSCDNPPCCNPRHLFLGSHADNMRDSRARGRHHQASKTHCKRGHKFTEASTYIRPDNGRSCRLCTAIRAKKYASQ